MFTARKVPDVMLFALVAANNQRQLDAIASFFHLDRTNSAEGSDYTNPTQTRLTVTAAAATDLATSVALANNIRTVLNTHFPDLIAHDTVATALLATPVATDLATGITLGNAEKAAYNTHLTLSGAHYTNDSTNATAATNASDQSSLNTLLNEMKADINAHMASAPAGSIVNVVAA